MNTPRHPADARAFTLIVLLFAAFGLLFGVWQVVLADLKKALDLSAGALGAALTVGVLASLPVMLAGGRIADRWGTRPVIAGTAVLMGLTFLGFATTGGLITLLPLLLVFFGASGMYDVGINAAAVTYEQARSRRVLTYFHAAFSGGAALGALVAGALLFVGVPFRTLYVLTALMLTGLALLVGRSRALPERSAHAPGAVKATGLYREPAILLLGGITAAGMFSEGTLENWSAIYLRTYLDLPVVLGASGVAVFHSAMLIGRLTLAPAVTRFGRRALLQAAGILATGGMLLALTTTSAPLILAGFLIVGLGLASVVPVGFSLAGDVAPGRAGEATSVIAVVGYSGFLVGPALIGALAEWLGLRLALGSVVIAGALILTLSLRTTAKA